MWKTIIPQAGDLIRVRRPFYYHFGIYIGDNKVIHFAGYQGDQTDNPNAVDVHEAPIEDFIRGDVLETYVLEEKDLNNVYTIEERLARAKACLGQKGYDFVYNNCEHFACRCYFKTMPKTQVDVVKEKLLNLINKKK